MRRLHIEALCIAGFLLLAPLAGAVVNAGQQKPAPKQPPKEEKQEKRVRGAREMADGQIKTVTCKGYALDMAFDDSYEILRLHTHNYLKVDFSAINFTPRGTMNPCKTAKGMYARVHYYHIQGHPKEGELISVAFRK